MYIYIYIKKRSFRIIRKREREKGERTGKSKQKILTKEKKWLIEKMIGAEY